MSNSELRVLAVLLAIAGMAVAVWYFRADILPKEPAPVVLPPEPEPEPQVKVTEPLHPVEPAAVDETGEIEALPALDESDTTFRAAIVNTLGSEIADLLVNEALVDRIVATIDNLPRQHIAEKIRPLGRLPSQFVAAGSADDRYFVLEPENFRRYETLVAQMVHLDIDAAVGVYRRYYPLFQESYERLGYPNAYFNDRVVEVIDHLLQTPEPQQPLQLTRPHVLYQFADPELEALSGGQKLLLRMGPSQSLQIKDVLRELRMRLVSGEVASLQRKIQRG